jgi:hypothetical protein
MTDERTVTIRANFETREAADVAVEHLVQQLGISRSDVSVQPVGEENTAGSKVSGGDDSHDHTARHDAPLQGDIEVSVDIALNELRDVNRIFGDLSAKSVSSN